MSDDDLVKMFPTKRELATEAMAEALATHNARIRREALEEAIEACKAERLAQPIAPDATDRAKHDANRETVAQCIAAIRALASDPAEVAAIISAATQLNKAGDGNKERSDEEDRG